MPIWEVDFLVLKCTWINERHAVCTGCNIEALWLPGCWY